MPMKAADAFANAISNDATRAGDAYQFAAVAMAGILQLITFAIVAFMIDWRIAIVGGIAGACPRTHHEQTHPDFKAVRLQANRPRFQPYRGHGGYAEQYQGA